MLGTAIIVLLAAFIPTSSQGYLRVAEPLSSTANTDYEGAFGYEIFDTSLRKGVTLSNGNSCVSGHSTNIVAVGGFRNQWPIVFNSSFRNTLIVQCADECYAQNISDATPLDSLQSLKNGQNVAVSSLTQSTYLLAVSINRYLAYNHFNSEGFRYDSVVDGMLKS